MTHEEFQKQLPNLVKDYQPAGVVLNKIKNLSLLMIIGPSGVGKTTIINQLNLHYVLSDTTRARRPDEQEGVDFYFRIDYAQIVNELEKGEFVQVAIDSGGDLKATKATFYPDSGWITMAIVTDVVPTMRTLGFKETISAFITPPSYEEWMRRIGRHHLTSEKLSKRLTEAKRSLRFALNDPLMHFVLNDDLDEGVRQTKNLVNNQTDPALEQTARRAAEAILDRID